MARTLLAALLAAAVLAVGADASAPPIGPLPAPQVTTVSTVRGARVAVAVPSRAGYVWRVARVPSVRVLRQVGEANVGTDVVLVFRAVGPGRTSVTLVQTRGERPTVYRAVRYDVTVR